MKILFLTGHGHFMNIFEMTVITGLFTKPVKTVIWFPSKTFDHIHKGSIIYIDECFSLCFRDTGLIINNYRVRLRRM